MNLAITESELTELTKELSQFTALIDQYNLGVAGKEAILQKVAYFEAIDWQKENMFNQMLGYFALASAYGNLKSKSLDHTKAYYDNEYVYKEISYYHNVQYVVSRVQKEQWGALYLSAFSLACRSYLGLANAYDHLGRFCEAQQYYRLAAEDKRNIEDVEFNQGYSYANMHAFWTEEEPWIVRKAQLLLHKYAQRYDVLVPGLRKEVYSWPSPHFDVPQVDFSTLENGNYELWVNENYLRVNRYCDVEPFSELSLKDNVCLEEIRDSSERKELCKSAFEEIKATFIDTRGMTFEVLDGDVSIQRLKMCYKSFYSILDKIALFLKAYLDIPVEVYRVDFATIWYEKKERLRTEFMNNQHNLSLLALYNVKLDVYGVKSFEYVIDEQTKDFQRIRNFMEHKIVEIKPGQMRYDDYKLTISKEELILNTIRLAQLVRCAIIYLCNFVMHTEYDKGL